MTPLELYLSAPLGSKIRFSNGQPRPPERFTRKVKTWENDNGTGTLIECQPGCDRPGFSSPATFGLHLATYSNGGVPILVVRRIYSVVGNLDFEILERPVAGSARVLTGRADNCELRHLAANDEAARAWLAEHHYHDARIELVSDPDPVDRPLIREEAA